MAVLPTTNCHTSQNLNPIFFAGRCHQRPCSAAGFSIRFNCRKLRRSLILSETRATSNSSANSDQDGEVDNLGVKAALSMLKFYKRGSGFDPPRWFDEERLPEPED